MRSYAIGDIHGHLDLLKLAHARITADRARTGDMEAPVIHIGDLVDRGPDSAGVIDYLLAGQIAGRPWVVLKGNHDRMFTLFLEGLRDWRLRSEYDWWHPRLGGMTTLQSYGLGTDAPIPALHAQALAIVPEAHRQFLADLPLHWRAGSVLFVHAGIAPGIPLAQQTEDDLLWIRDPFLTHTAAHEWLVVHGHTHIERARHYGNRVNIDSSSAYGGPLTAVVIEDGLVWSLTDDGRTPLLPEAD